MVADASDGAQETSIDARHASGVVHWWINNIFKSFKRQTSSMLGKGVLSKLSAAGNGRAVCDGYIIQVVKHQVTEGAACLLSAARPMPSG